MAGVQALKIVDSVPGVLSKRSIHNILSDKMRTYLLSMQLHSSQQRKVKFTAQWKSTANQLKLKLTLARNVMLHSEVHEVDTTDAFHAAILDEYKDLFRGDLGNVHVVYKMRLDANVTPVVMELRAYRMVTLWPMPHEP